MGEGVVGEGVVGDCQSVWDNNLRTNHNRLTKSYGMTRCQRTRDVIVLARGCQSYQQNGKFGTALYIGVSIFQAIKTSKSGLALYIASHNTQGYTVMNNSYLGSCTIFIMASKLSFAALFLTAAPPFWFYIKSEFFVKVTILDFRNSVGVIILCHFIHINPCMAEPLYTRFQKLLCARVIIIQKI